MNLSRREMLLRSLAGVGSLGIASLATGLPVALLANPRRALAQGMPACADRGSAQYLILSTSGSGDPVNCNVPGTYDRADIVHSSDPSMAATPITLGGQRTRAAHVWSTLPQPVLDRTCFFHHATYTNSHPNEPKVLRLMGATAYDESLPSIYTKYLAGCLGTIQAEPVVLGAGQVVSFNGRAIASLTPTSLRATLGSATGPLGGLQALRDRRLDEINAVLRNGATPAQRSFIDELVTSRQQARSISDELLTALASITDNGPAGQITAAVTLIRMNVAPAMVISIPFGGDNHSDPGLMNEAAEHQSGVASIASLASSLQSASLQDRVTFALLNVFGRTLKSTGNHGRTHWANHHAGIVISSRTRAGVIGGLEPSADGGDYSAMSIDPSSGRGVPGGHGGIPAGETLESFAKTLGRTLGVPQDVLDAAIMHGATVPAALA